MNGMYQFPSWLGQNSKQSKSKRILGELCQKMSTKISGSKIEVCLQYFPVLAAKLTTPLIKNETDGIDKVIQLMDDYYITKEDWDSMLELGYQEKLGQIETKIKTSFTKK
jgi:replication factor C subunit 1